MTALAILTAWCALDAFGNGEPHDGWCALFLVFFYAGLAVLISRFGVHLELLPLT